MGLQVMQHMQCRVLGCRGVRAQHRKLLERSSCAAAGTEWHNTTLGSTYCIMAVCRYVLLNSHCNGLWLLCCVRLQACPSTPSPTRTAAAG